eukprot:197350-Pyramimonas_sp.AAC.1
MEPMRSRNSPPGARHFTVNYECKQLDAIVTDSVDFHCDAKMPTIRDARSKLHIEDTMKQRESLA